MKRKMFVFVFILLCITNIKVSALSKFSYGTRIPNMHITVVKDKHTAKLIPLTVVRDDGEIVYSIDPYSNFNTTDYYEEYNYNDEIFNITSEQINKINLIAYYGYNYKNHTDLKWYGVTQFLIWETLGFDEVYFTDVKTKEKTDEYNDEVEEIKKLIEEYYLLPSIANNNYEYSANSNYELEDINKKIQDYEIKESDIDSKIVDNKLIINPKEEGTYKIKFKKKKFVNRDYKLYYLNNSKSIFYPGKLEDINFDITIKVNSDNIIINKTDKENNEYGNYNEKEVIVVEVPDTLKYDYNEYISIGLIVLGSIILVFEKIRKIISKNY